MQLTPYHAKYFAYELTKRCSSDSLQKLAVSLSDAQVDLNPHQVEAALFAFRSPLSRGAILADEVGLGKTIEAGILLSQKWAERKRKILIILPSNLRIQHPLAQRIVEKCKAESLPRQKLIFQYSDSGKKISILEPLIGKSGWLSLINLTINSFESEDNILFCGITDDGSELDIEQCRRMFSLSSTINTLESDIIAETQKQLNQIVFKQKADILQVNAERNAGFFDNEMDKLDKWADDVKNSLEIELKELDKEIKFRKTEAKKILSLEEKVKTQRQIKEMEKKRNSLRMNLYQAQDEVDGRKESLINEIEARLKQKIETNELFTIKWKVF